MCKRPMTILLVDDDDVTAEGVRRGLRGMEPQPSVIHVADGRVALDRLRGDDGMPPLERPYLVLLDLKMPVLDGFEFMDEVRRDEALRDTVIFVLTTSDLESDRKRAYRHSIAGYIEKANVGKGFGRLGSLLSTFREAVTLPE